MISSPRRTGRARVQVLLILGILLLLAGLILTGVVRVRQEASRMSCGNNLKQLGIAADYYPQVFGCLPPLVDQGDGSPTGRGLPSVFATLEPYLEARPVLYRAGQFPPEAYHAPSTTPFTYHNTDGTTGTYYGGMANESWKLFVCPSDITAEQLRDIPMTLPDGTTGYYATGSYAANGMLPWNKKVKAVNSSNTILFAERPQVCRTVSGEVVYNLWGVGFYSPQMPAFATLTPTEPAGLWSTGQVAPVLPLTEEKVRIGRANAVPTRPDFTTPVQRIRSGSPCDPRLPGSLHPDGMNVVMADGSVRVFRYDMTPWVFWAACVPE